MRRTPLILSVMVLLVILLAAACDNDSSPTATSVPPTQAPTEEASETPVPTVEETEEATEASEVTVEASETPEATEPSEETEEVEATEQTELTDEARETSEASDAQGNDSPTPTEEVIDTGDPVEVIIVTREGGENINVGSQNDEYSVMVNLVSLENFNEALAAPPQGFKWVQIDATLANEAADEPIEVLEEAIFLIDSEGNRYSPEAADEFVNPPLVGQMIEPGEFFRGFARFAIPQDVDSTILEWCLDATCNEVIQAKADSK